MEDSSLVTGGQITLVVVIFVFSALVSAVAGFGFGLISVPLMSLVVDVHRAVVLSAIVGTSITVYQAWRWRRFAVVPIVKRVVVAAYLGMPLGLILFVTVDSRWLKLALGTAVLVAVGLLLRSIDLRHAGPRLDVGAGFVSGVLNTSLSTNGPPLVFLLQSRRLEPDAFRGTLAVTFALSNVASVTAFAVRGEVTGSTLLTAVATLPAMVVGLVAGAGIRPHVDPAMFRRLVIVLLTMAGLAAMLTA